MIILKDVSKEFYLNGKTTLVADKINAVFPDKTSVGILGRNGAGKSSLMKMIAGTMEPDDGEIVRTGTVSWPVGFAGSFHPDLTGSQNVRFIARVYGVDTDDLARFVLDFSELGGHFHMPVRTYSSGMKSRLAFGTSMGIRFDTYLVDEITAVGDGNFRKRSEALFLERISESSMIMVTHAMPQIKRLCHMACVLDEGRLTVFDNVDQAIATHQSDLRRNKAAGS